MQEIIVYTLFDITKTDVLRNYKPAYLSGHPTINTEQEWIKARHQQQNWETVIQLLSLRANPLSINNPINFKTKLDDYGYHMFLGIQWMFKFRIESNEVFRKGDDPVGLLKEDFNNVPMISNLNENVIDCEYFKAIGEQVNVRFKVLQVAL